MTTTSLQQQHVQMLLKYSGISFISGAVNHGFFTVERSLWTALAGIVLFVLGVWLEHRRPAGDGARESLGATLLWGTLLSIGLGLFTGGLQHFPDSPARSAWVVPLGFALSVLALVVERMRAHGSIGRGLATYVLLAGLLTVAGSVGAWQWYEAHPHHVGDPAHGTQGGHGHSHRH